MPKWLSRPLISHFCKSSFFTTPPPWKPFWKHGRCVKSVQDSLWSATDWISMQRKKEVNAQFLKIHHHLFAKLWFFCQCKKRFVNSQFWQMTLKMTGKSLQLSGLLAIIGRQLGVSKSNLTWKWVSFHTRRSKSLWIFECHVGA